MNDIFIAIAAARNGLVVVTTNYRGFLHIEKHTAVRWMLPDSRPSKIHWSEDAPHPVLRNLQPG